MLGLGRFSSFLVLYTFGRLPVTTPCPHKDNISREETEISLLPVGFERRTQVFERAKTVDAPEHAATETGNQIHSGYIKFLIIFL